MYGSKTEDYIQETNYENVDMIPANASTPRINTCIPQILEDVSEGLEDGDPRKNISAESFLDYFLNQVKENYDYIVIDTQPTRDALLLTNALAAADYVLIPMMPDAYSETSAFRTWAMCNGLKESGKYHIKERAYSLQIMTRMRLLRALSCPSAKGTWLLAIRYCCSCEP